MIWTTEFSGKFLAKARSGDCFSSYTATDLVYLKEKNQRKKQTKIKELIATWLGSCSTSPPCGSSKNPSRDPCGGQETSWPHSLLLPKQKAGRDGAGASWRGRTLRRLSWSNLEMGSDSLFADDGAHWQASPSPLVGCPHCSEPPPLVTNPSRQQL